MTQKKTSLAALALLKKYEEALNSGRVLTSKERQVYQSLLNQLK